MRDKKAELLTEIREEMDGIVDDCQDGPCGETYFDADRFEERYIIDKAGAKLFLELAENIKKYQLCTKY